MSVSYLITLYNKEEFIADVLDAVLAEQAITGGEVIIYDDVSTDRSASIVQERIAAHPAQSAVIQVKRGDINRGVSFGTNYLVAAATQPYIRLVDADDMPVLGSTAQMMRLMQKHKLDFIYGKMKSKEEKIGEQTYDECFMIADPISVVSRHLPAIPSSSFFAAAMLKKICPLPEWVRRTQDFTIFFRLALHGAVMGGINEVVVRLPPVYTANNLSSGSAAAYAEMSRTVALEEKKMPLGYLRNITRRYAGRVLKYFAKDGESRLSMNEKCQLWFWRQSARMASPQICVDRLNKIADLFDRDRHVIRGLRKTP